MGQNLKFMKFVFLGEELIIYVELIELLDRKKTCLMTRVRNSKEKIVIEGEALVKLP